MILRFPGIATSWKTQKEVDVEQNKKRLKGKHKKMMRPTETKITKKTNIPHGEHSFAWFGPTNRVFRIDLKLSSEN